MAVDISSFLEKRGRERSYGKEKEVREERQCFFGLGLSLSLVEVQLKKNTYSYKSHNYV